MSSSEATILLNAAAAGDQAAAEQLLPLVYDQLRRIAQQRMKEERAGHTLQATALVHEAYLRLTGNTQLSWQGRAHFFAAAAEAMRRILVESARRRATKKHGGGHRQVELTECDAASLENTHLVLAVSEALERLANEDPRKAELVKLRFFGGMTIAEAAAVMDISHATAERFWTYSRLRLFQWLGDDSAGPEANEPQTM